MPVRKEEKKKATKPTEKRKHRDIDGSVPDRLNPTSVEKGKPPGCRDGGQSSPRF